MRVRTAQVNVNKAVGLEAFFKHAVDRHLAWAVGVGRVYADLEKVANRYGYTVWVSDSDATEGSGLWAVVRQDLLADEDWLDEGDTLTFDTVRDGLGPVTLGDDSFDDEPGVSVLSKSVTAEFDAYSYSEILYSVPTR